MHACVHLCMYVCRKHLCMYSCIFVKGRVQKKNPKKNVDRGRTLGGGGSGKIFAGPQFYCDFGKLSLGGN